MTNDSTNGVEPLEGPLAGFIGSSHLASDQMTCR
jgi:hypothetical protein